VCVGGNGDVVDRDVVGVGVGWCGVNVADSVDDVVVGGVVGCVVDGDRVMFGDDVSYCGCGGVVVARVADVGVVVVGIDDGGVGCVVGVDSGIGDGSVGEMLLVLVVVLMYNNHVNTNQQPTTSVQPGTTTTAA